MISTSKKNRQSLSDTKLADVHFPFPSELFQFRSCVNTELVFSLMYNNYSMSPLIPGIIMPNFNETNLLC